MATKKITITKDGVTRGIDLTATTATPETVLSGYTFKQADGTDGVGTAVQGIIPSGNLEITENGDYNVTEKASVSVNVESTGGDWKYSEEANDTGTTGIFEFVEQQVSTITLKIAEADNESEYIEFTAEEGMTWKQFAESEYANTQLSLPNYTCVFMGEVYTQNNKVSLSMNEYGEDMNWTVDVNDVTPTDTISATTYYVNSWH